VLLLPAPDARFVLQCSGGAVAAASPCVVRGPRHGDAKRVKAGGGAGARYRGGSLPASRNTFTSSSGSGKMMVEFFSAEISTSVWR
jgi:hypothetical protein